MTQANQPELDAKLVDEACHGQRGDDQRRISLASVKTVAMLLRKNTDYGSSVFSPPILNPSMTPKEALLVRMSDKVARMARLLQTNRAEIEESLEDTIQDLAGYCLLWLSLPREKEHSLTVSLADGEIITEEHIARVEANRAKLIEDHSFMARTPSNRCIRCGEPKASHKHHDNG